MSIERLALMILFLCWSGIAQAGGVSERVCSREDQFQAETEIDGLNNWQLVYSAYQRFSHCDDGSIAEGYSDSVIRLLADQWGQFVELNRLTSSSKGFEKFVLRHINELASKDDIQIILGNVQKSCPKESQRLCRLIEDAGRK